MNRRRVAVFCAILLLAVAFGIWFLKKSPEPVPQQAVVAADEKTHVVRRGEFLRMIAGNYPGIGWEDVLLRNETYLREQYNLTCPKLSSRYTNRPGRKGSYCNDRFNRPYGNTLRAGWRLLIPSGTAPQSIAAVVAGISGKRVALVIDDSDSMTEDRRAVGQFYTAALRQYGKDLIGVWLYADGHVRHYEAGSVEFKTDGGIENTRSALEAAAAEKPDAIVLITDEPGDDWGDWRLPPMPPVYAHCLPNVGGQFECDETLHRLVKHAGGQYISKLELPQ